MTPRVRAPVVLVVFRRPEVTRRTLEVLRLVRPERLYVVGDGPRPGRDEEAALCAEVRALVDAAVDWPCHVERRYAERNLGLEANMELGLDWVFSQVDRAIVLEDDCIPDKTFFAYCDELLDRYSGEPRVWQIAGDSKSVPSSAFAGCSYDFSTWASVWGWATWSDRWQAHRKLFPRDHDKAEEWVDREPRTADAVRETPAIPRSDALVTHGARRHFTRVAQETNGDLRGWDHHWWVTIMSEGGLSITPSVNLVENDGYGEGATHTRSAKNPHPAVPMPFPLVHPTTVELNREVEAALEFELLKTDGQLSRLVRRMIRPFWLRAIVRRTMSLPGVRNVVRRLLAR